METALTFLIWTAGAYLSLAIIAVIIFLIYIIKNK